eukprot:5055079-Amphidinium_carterae.1
MHGAHHDLIVCCSHSAAAQDHMVDVKAGVLKKDWLSIAAIFELQQELLSAKTLDPRTQCRTSNNSEQLLRRKDIIRWSFLRTELNT